MGFFQYCQTCGKLPREYELILLLMKNKPLLDLPGVDKRPNEDRERGEPGKKAYIDTAVEEMIQKQGWKVLFDNDNSQNNDWILENIKNGYIRKVLTEKFSYEYEEKICKHIEQELKRPANTDLKRFFVLPYEYGVLRSNPDTPEQKTEEVFFMDMNNGGRSLKKVFGHTETKSKKPKMSISSSVHELVEIFNDVLVALKFLHSINVYHQDLHWGNILCNDKGQEPKIIDFGIAVHMTPENWKDENVRKKIVTLPPELSNQKESPEVIPQVMKFLTKEDIFRVARCMYLILKYIDESITLLQNDSLQNIEDQYISMVLKELKSKSNLSPEKKTFFIMLGACIISDSVQEVFDLKEQMTGNEMDLTRFIKYKDKNKISGYGR